MNHLELLESILMVDDVRSSLKNNEKILFQMIPMLQFEKDFIQNNPWHMYDVWNHTIEAVSKAKDFTNRLVMLLHDIGKPFSYQDDSMGRHFHGHALKSKEIAQNILNDWKIDDDFKNLVLSLIGEHATKIDLDKVNNDNLDYYLRLVDIQLCDGEAYEVSHAKMISEELNVTKRKLKTMDFNKKLKKCRRRI